MYKRFSIINVLSLLLFLILTTGSYAMASVTESGDIQKVTITELKQKIRENSDQVLIVDFWASWCPPCRDEIPGFISLYNEYKEKGLEILGVALDENGSDSVKRFAKKMGINYPLLLGGYDINKEYNITALPTTFIYNRNGVLKIKHIGYFSKSAFEKEINELLK